MVGDRVLACRLAFIFEQGRRLRASTETTIALRLAEIPGGWVGHYMRGDDVRVGWQGKGEIQWLFGHAEFRSGSHGATIEAGTESNLPTTLMEIPSVATTMRAPRLVLSAFFLLLVATGRLSEAVARAPQAAVREPQSEAEKHAMLDRVIANQKRNDEALDIYERIERRESRKGPAGSPPEIKISRVVPAGTGVDHIPVGADGQPTDSTAYRTELEKLERSLAWAAEDGHAQREAYDKIARKQKDRAELIDATRSAFLYTFVDQEPRGDRMLSKYRMEPNPAYKPTSRATAIFAKVRGYAWIDEAASQLARVDVEVTDDISIGGFLAKVYKGSHFMQERYEMAPGLWLPSYSQYDFDGRRLFVSFSIHERTLYTRYHHIGPPKEALATIRSELGRAELGKPSAAIADP
jgi:hypothetical protein